MTPVEAAKYITENLKTIYEAGEAASIADWVMEYITGNARTERASTNQVSLTVEQHKKINVITSRLLTHEPVQYVLNESWFSGLKFYVDKNVLIPRPETEELVEWIIGNYKLTLYDLKILDIGTGSGCIPIVLKKRMPKAEVWACDISAGALEVAIRNAAALGTEINFIQLDFLDSNTWHQLPSFDIIVSNPPYIPQSDKKQMQPNVLKYEPATALFVPENDPLIFYKAIAEFGKTRLNKSGSICTEIHESLGESTMAIFQSAGFSTELKKDMQQKDRMIRAVCS